jgi:hypothetical protein
MRAKRASGCGDCGRAVYQGSAIQRDADGVLYHAECDAGREYGFDYTADAAKDAAEAATDASR